MWSAWVIVLACEPLLWNKMLDTLLYIEIWEDC